eukprot:TRINITY_DN9190_c0_g1_i1.p1 TRINITY_DN9190_c0_g1~~TRINITY_DN9190_c0_g1_i1.p1  ORF type:complete len:165 (+),score=46.59 TRINITY_DN9190_c0_g1_i1:69-497(+)
MEGKPNATQAVPFEWDEEDEVETPQDETPSVPKPTPKGVPISGRTWKLEAKRASLRAGLPVKLRSDMKEKMTLKLRDQALKKKVKEIEQRKKAEREAEKKRIEDRRKRKAENAKKSAVVQIITNKNTIKRMSKEQKKKLIKM